MNMDEETPRWRRGAPGSGRADDPSRGLESPDDKGGEHNPAHDTHVDVSDELRKHGPAEVREQPTSVPDARQPGVDNPTVDE
jgi:hypothetical protein